MLCIMQAEVLKFNLNNLAYEVLITLGTGKKDERKAVTVSSPVIYREGSL
jgi:hypothetical protein